MTCVMRKQTLRSLSLSYQKKDGRGHDTGFKRIWSMKSKDSNSKKSVSYQKKDGGPSGGWCGNDKDLKVCFLVTHINLGFHWNVPCPSFLIGMPWIFLGISGAYFSCYGPSGSITAKPQASYSNNHINMRNRPIEAILWMNLIPAL